MLHVARAGKGVSVNTALLQRAAAAWRPKAQLGLAGGLAGGALPAAFFLPGH